VLHFLTPVEQRYQRPYSNIFGVSRQHMYMHRDTCMHACVVRAREIVGLGLGFAVCLRKAIKCVIFSRSSCGIYEMAPIGTSNHHCKPYEFGIINGAAWSFCALMWAFDQTSHQESSQILDNVSMWSENCCYWISMAPMDLNKPRLLLEYTVMSAFLDRVEWLGPYSAHKSAHISRVLHACTMAYECTCVLLTRIRKTKTS